MAPTGVNDNFRDSPMSQLPPRLAPQEAAGSVLPSEPTMSTGGATTVPPMVTDHELLYQTTCGGQQRVHYDECDGSCLWSDSPDCLASKGFMGVTVSKDGFSIRVYTTHTQASNNSDAVRARESQIAQLADSINSYRATHPSHPVIVMGDFNVI